MTPSYGDLIRKARAARGLSQEELAARVGVSRNAVAGWETGHSRPDLNSIPALCAALKISLARFFGQEKPRTARERRVLELFFSLEEGDQQIMEWQMEALAARREEQRKERPAIRRIIPLFRNDLGAAAGFGAVLDEACGEPMLLAEDELTALADEVITVSGRSMEPTYFDGDQVLVQHTDSLRPGEIGIFLVEGEGYIKEYQPDGLHSHNPAYPVMTFGAHQSVQCLGRVLGALQADQLPTPEERSAYMAGKKEAQ